MSAGETFDPNYVPDDPVADALDLFARDAGHHRAGARL